MGCLTKNNALVLGAVGIITVFTLVHLTSSNNQVQEQITRLASQILEDSRPTDIKDTLAPYGEEIPRLASQVLKDSRPTDIKVDTLAPYGEKITRLASQVLKDSRPTDIKVDTLAPCGEVCSYSGKVAEDKPSDLYPQLTKNIDCVNIMRRMAFRHHNITRPPPREIPTELIDAYTQNGVIRLGKPWYFDTIKHDPRRQITFNNADIDTLVDKVVNGENINSYRRDGNCAMDMVEKYSKHIVGRKAVVIGTQRPWLESMLLANGARHVTTLEYNELVYNLPEMSFFDPYSYAEMYLRGETEPFEVAATFSSLEHSGLGRYGDPINPYGDLEAMAQMWCMLKPGATAIVGVPGSPTGSSKIRWNAHRAYGPDRLQHLTANFDVVEAKKCDDIHVVVVLTKP